jgi:NitT/TauT family transport system substrate-binding protein
MQLQDHQQAESHDSGTSTPEAARPQDVPVVPGNRTGIGSVVVVLLGIAGWLIKERISPAQTARPQAYQGPIEDIIIGNVGEYSIFNLIAKDKGYFAQNGLRATIKEYASGPPAVADLLAGKSDFAIGADFVGVNNLFTNPHLRIVSQVSHQHAFQMVARKDKGIAAVSDLRGKKVGVTKKGAGEFFLGRFLNLNDLQVDDVTEIDMTPTDMISQITNGQIDAIVIFEPHPYNLAKSLGSAVTVWPVQGKQATLALAYATDTVINAKPDVVRRYVASLVQAEEFLQAHPAEAKQLLARTMKYDAAYVSYIWPKITFGLSLNQNLLVSMEDEARFLIDSKATPQTKVPNYLESIYFDGLEKAKPQAVTVIH